MFSPHLASHDTGGVAAITDSHSCLVIDQSWYLLTVTLIGWREVDSCQLTFGIAGGMQFEAIVPALVVLANWQLSLWRLCGGRLV